MVPLLAKIRTKEPAVMVRTCALYTSLYLTICQMSTLAVHEAMGMKVDREAVATLVLPQLWAMSMGPCESMCMVTRVGSTCLLSGLTVLSVSQFKRFMEVIKRLGDRVQKEHDQYLRDSQRIEDRSATAVNGITTPNMGGTVDFESLVAGNAATVKADTVMDSSKNWDDDVWGSIFNNSEVRWHRILSICLVELSTECYQPFDTPDGSYLTVVDVITLITKNQHESRSQYFLIKAGPDFTAKCQRVGCNVDGFNVVRFARLLTPSTVSSIVFYASEVIFVYV